MLSQNRFVSKIKTFFAYPGAVKWLFAEAVFTSAWVKLSLKFFPFKRVMGWLGKHSTETASEANADTLLLRNHVKGALILCNKYTFWRTECYTLSLTGKLLLKRRNIKSTLYIGFQKEETGKIKGHAWLRANDTYISGYRESIGFTVQSFFS